MEMNLDSVPYMTTLNGQSFAQAYSQMYQQMVFSGVSPANVTPQPFIESALGGASSAYCKAFTSCTAALASNNTTVIKETAVSDLWTAMNKVASWTLGRTNISQGLNGGAGIATSTNINTSLGSGNYNAAFASLRMMDWHGVTAISNFTFGRSLGTSQLAQYNSAATPLDIFNLHDSYGSQGFDIKLVYNFSAYYTPPVFRGQKGVVGHILGGWTFSPIFTAQSGGPTAVSYSHGSGTSAQSFGEVMTGGSTTSTSDDAVGYAPYTGEMTLHYNTLGTTGTNIWQGTQSVGTQTSGRFNLNAFSNPAAVYGEFRPCVLGFDTSCGGYANIRGLSTWNVDMSVVKDVGIYKERVGATMFFTFTNILNHYSPSGPSLSLTTPATFGEITGQANSPRSMEFGFRLRF
jgi:hypothetical protein